MQLVQFRDLGIMEYGYAWKLQESIFNDIVEKKLQNRIRTEEEQLSYNHQLLLIILSLMNYVLEKLLKL